MFLFFFIMSLPSCCFRGHVYGVVSHAAQHAWRKKLYRRAQAECLVYPHVSQHDLVQRLCMYVFVLAGAL